MKTNLTYILFDIHNSIAFEWIVKYLKKEEFKITFILILNQENSVLESYLKHNKIDYYRFNYFGKKSIPKLIWKVFKILRKTKTKVVHTHIFEANFIGFIAAKLARVPKRIYTRHHSTLHHKYHKKGVFYDKLINQMATDIIAITEVVKNVLVKKESTPEKKIHLIYHGFDVKYFQNKNVEKILKLKEKYQIPSNSFVIGVVSRYTNLKGIEYIIEAFKRLLPKHNQVKLVLANALGDYTPVIQSLLSELPEKYYVEITYERDMPSLYNIMDVFVHVPIDPEVEAFGQIYVEAMLVGIPSIVTLSGIAHEYIEDKKNALVVDYCNSEQIFLAIEVLISNKKLYNEIALQGKLDTENKFTIEDMIYKMRNLYLG